MSRAKDPMDPKGLIYEAYRIEGITAAECRSIFVDWALTTPGDAPRDMMRDLLTRYGADAPEHPMSVVLREGLEAAPGAKRRGGRAGRLGTG